MFHPFSIVFMTLLAAAASEPYYYGTPYIPEYAAAYAFAPEVVPAVAPAPLAAPLVAPTVPLATVSAYSYSLNDYLLNAAAAPVYGSPYTYASSWLYRK